MMLLQRLVVVAACVPLLCCAQTPPSSECIPYLNMPDGDLPNMPMAANSSEACANLCKGHEQCALYTFVSSQSTRCTQFHNKDGCCWLKETEVSGKAPVVWDPYACSAWIRIPSQGKLSVQEKKDKKRRQNKADGKMNVLYIVVDDLRPDLVAYGQNFTHNPNIASLAEEGIVFDNAYCQISVCSPSRLSFLTGRRPDHAGMYNFINHFRQSDCGISLANTAFSAESYRVVNTGTFGGGCQWGGQVGACGGSGQCCSLCSQDSNCTHWTYGPGNNCYLKACSGSKTVAQGVVSGVSGSATPSSHALWTTNPQNFKNNGYLTLQTGKIFHTEEGGVGNQDPNLNGPGMPPNEDPPSWHQGLSMAQVNAVAQMYGTAGDEVNGVAASLDGILNETSSNARQLCDRVISTDAIAKLRLATMNRNTTGQPFFMAVGFRKPHLAFRFPAPWLAKLPVAMEDTAVAEHPTLDSSVPSVAHCDNAPQGNPFVPVDNETAKQWRAHYYAAIAWMDSQVGRVLDELENLGQKENTLVVLHSDHGWSLGEHGEWQKFSNFEHGTRVPLIMRAPFIPGAVGRSSVLAELIDVFPTMADVVGIPLPPNEVLDGKSLLPILKDVSNMNLAKNLKPYALSQYMRCPVNISVPWKNNHCLFDDRVLLKYMGYTIRTPTYRFTEWTLWNGSALAPDHTKDGLVGVELYSHVNAGISYSFDSFENKNEAADNPEVVAMLRTMLHEAIANQSRIPSLKPN
eukprot:m.38126 g.38126  ORF g.38126 m.38126 type:complete len:742 (-) comp9393_c0_seq1:117-2342(-)